MELEISKDKESVNLSKNQKKAQNDSSNDGDYSDSLQCENGESIKINFQSSYHFDSVEKERQPEFQLTKC